jgi:uncharacterized repeat protein (TIGR03803 family)
MMTTKGSRSRLTAATPLAMLAASCSAIAQERVIFPLYVNFGNPLDNNFSSAGVISDAYGNLYTSGGSGCGSFSSSCPSASLVRLLPPFTTGGQWQAEALVNVGAPMYTGLAIDRGNLYGTAWGGTSGAGFVFQFNSKTGLQTIYNFKTGEANVPASAMVVDSAGNLYGASYSDPIFQLIRPATYNGSWTESVIYNFASTGTAPSGLIIDKSGNLFGSTIDPTGRKGLVFELSPPTSTNGTWTEQTLYTFSDTACPQTSTCGFPSVLVSDAAGNLYGARAIGGAIGYGYIYKLSPPATSGGTWSFSTLYSFAGTPDGDTPNGVTVGDNGVLYGTTYAGGNTAGDYTGSLGIIFKLTPPVISGGSWTETILRRFTGGFDGMNPAAAMIRGKGNVLYGTTTSGGANAGCSQYNSSTGNPGCGTVFEIIP